MEFDTGFILIMSRVSTSSLFFEIGIAVILHLSFTITIDSFGEQFTKKYQIELVNARKY
jgi:hypothetical protein